MSLPEIREVLKAENDPRGAQQTQALAALERRLRALESERTVVDALVAEIGGELPIRRVAG